MREFFSQDLKPEAHQKKQQELKQQDGKTKTSSSPAPMDISANSDSNAFSRKILSNVQDIDAEDYLNPQLVSVYVNDIYKYMWELERKYPVKERYLDGMAINGRMRGILMDWLIQVHLRFHLLQETLYLTVAIIDRFLEVGICPLCMCKASIKDNCSLLETWIIDLSFPQLKFSFNFAGARGFT